MLVNNSLYSQCASILQVLNSLQTEYDVLVQQNISPQVVQSVSTQIEVIKAQLEKVTDELVYINPFSGERELPVEHELVILD